MKISIVAPFYNEQRYIEKCLEALQAQDYPQDSYEIIMVDNNSTDRSREIIREYSRVKLLSEPVQGDFAARNRGLAESSGEIVAFTDSNCAPSSDWLQNIASAMLKESVWIVLGSLYFAPGSLALSMMAAYESEKAAFSLTSNNREIFVGYTSNMAVRRDLFNRMGPFPPIYRNSDVVFLRRAVDTYSCDIVRYSPEVSVRHLEISNLWRYYRKMRTYGRDFPRYSKAAAVRPLSNRERFQVFKRTIQSRNYSLTQSALLILLLSVGGICYDLARLSASRGTRP